MKAKFKAIMISVITLSSSIVFQSSAHAGTTYNFTVTCQHQRVIERWETGDIDPGKEYLRMITGTKYPGCSVGEFNPYTDGALPVNRHSDIGGVIDGLPPIQVIEGVLESIGIRF
jgi:hypothetical protein